MSEGIGTLRELRAALDARESSSVEIVGRCLRRAEASQETLRAFVGLRAEVALREAEESRRAPQMRGGPLSHRRPARRHQGQHGASGRTHPIALLASSRDSSRPTHRLRWRGSSDPGRS